GGRAPVISRRAGADPKLAPQVAPQPQHLAHDADDHPGRGQGGGPAGPREVVDADLDDVGPRPAAADEELGVDEAALAGEADPLQERAAEELEGEVDVPEVEPEERAHEGAVD